MNFIKKLNNNPFIEAEKLSVEQLEELIIEANDAFFNSDNVIVDIKLIMVCFDLKLKFLIIFSPTEGVTDKKTQSELSIIY